MFQAYPVKGVPEIRETLDKDVRITLLGSGRSVAVTITPGRVPKPAVSLRPSVFFDRFATGFKDPDQALLA
jgi:hypothetical protein